VGCGRGDIGLSVRAGQHLDWIKHTRSPEAWHFFSLCMLHDYRRRKWKVDLSIQASVGAVRSLTSCEQLRQPHFLLLTSLHFPLSSITTHKSVVATIGSPSSASRVTGTYEASCHDYCLLLTRMPGTSLTVFATPPLSQGTLYTYNDIGSNEKTIREPEI
jgi:hypothetical protein